MNVAPAIDKDAATFRKLKRVILKGGCIQRGYGDLGYHRSGRADGGMEHY